MAIWAALFQLLILVYWPALEAPFVYDDIQCIVLNPDLRSPVEISRFFSNHKTSMQFDHRPLVGIATMINYQIAGLNVVPYRIFNLLIHWSVAVVLGEFIIALAKHFQLSGGRRLGFLVAVFWALHPLNTVTVIFITQRMESLMVLFYLLALWSLLKAGREGDSRFLAGAVLATIASLASKEVGVTLVASLLMLDRVCHFSSWKELIQRRWKFYLIQFLVGAVFITWWTSGERIAELQGVVLSEFRRGYFTDLAQVLLAQGKAEEASGYLKTVLADDPQDFMTLILYGEALIRCGNATEGEEILKQGERIAPDASPLQEVRKRLQKNRK